MSGKKIDISSIPKLEDNNYLPWCKNVTVVLKHNKVWEVVEGKTTRPTVEKDQPAWDDKDLLAQAILLPTIGAAQTNAILSCNTGKEIFDKLKELNADHSIFNKQLTMSKFLKYKIDIHQSVITGYLEMQKFANSLRDMGEPVSDLMLTTQIVEALPDSKFLAFKKAWDSVTENEKTMVALLARLKKEDLLLKQTQEEAAVDAKPSTAFMSSEQGKRTNIAELKKRTNCNACGKKGHWARECRSKKPPGAQKDETESPKPKSKSKTGKASTAFMVRKSFTINSQTWFCDSGATSHITGSREWFTSYHELDPPESFSLTDNHQTFAVGKGTVKLDAFIKGEWRACTISDVKYIPGAVNLFSSSAMAKKGFICKSDDTGAYFKHKDGSRGPEAELTNGMYIMKFRELIAERACTSRQETAKRLHCRLAHIGMPYLRNTIAKGAATGIKLEELGADVDCDACHLGKATRQPFPAIPERAKTKPGQFVHADLAGPMPTASLNGAKYFLLMKDDATGFRMVEFLRTKDMEVVFGALKRAILLLETQTGRKLKILKTDNGTEFINSTVEAFTESNGILHQKSPPHCPESNGRIEREIRTIKDTARAMLKHHDSPDFLWAEAVATSVYIHNRVLDKQSPEKTAFERIFKKKPSLAHARIFGSKCFAHIPKEFRRVWDPKSKELTFVGYDSASNKYRLFDEEKRKVITAHSVRFQEELESLSSQSSLIETSDSGSSSSSESSDSDDSGGDSQHTDEHSEAHDDDSSNEEETPKDELDANPEDNTGNPPEGTPDDTSEPNPEETEQHNPANQEENSDAWQKFYQDWLKRQQQEAGEEEDTEAQTPPAVPPKPSKTKTVLQISTPGGNVQADIPPVGAQSVVQPSPSDRNLRDRTTLKPPDRYTAHATFEDVPNSYQQALNSPDADEWMDAMIAEIRSHLENETWVLVDLPKNAKPLESRWIFRIKRNLDGSIDRYKARLVVKGFKQRFGIDYDETFSAVCRFESIRILLAVAAVKSYSIMQFDVTTAFLNGELDAEIYMHQPEGFNTASGDNPPKVCLLRRSLYGLKQAPRVWSQTFTGFLQRFNFTATASDPCVFRGTCDHHLVLLVIYVDDGLLMSPNPSAINKVLKCIRSAFKIKVSNPENFVGFEIRHNIGGDITISQKKYVQDLLQKFKMTDCTPTSVPMVNTLALEIAKESNKNLLYRELVGSLLFLARTTRPDIAFAVSKLSQFLSGYNETHWKAAKNVLRYLKGHPNLGIVYEPNQEVLLTGFTDSDYAADKNNRKSMTGFIFLINGVPISWCSQKQPIVTLSSTEAEYVALATGAKEVVWLRQLLSEIGCPQREPTTIFVDNQSTISLAKDHVFHNRSKHIEVRHHYSREVVAKRKVVLAHVPTTHQAADILTKPLQKTKHAEMRSFLGMTDLSVHVEQEKKAEKAVTTRSLEFALMTVLFLSLMAPTDAFSNKNTQPVIWRPSPSPITVGHVNINLRIRLLSPCLALSEEVIISDGLEAARQRCEMIYKSYFLNEIRSMCPPEVATEVHLRPERAILSILIGSLSVLAITVAGLGIGGLVKSYSTSGKVENLQSLYEHQQKTLQGLTGRVEYVEKAVKYVKLELKYLRDTISQQQASLDEVKAKQVASIFAISYIASRMQISKHIILEASRQWRQGKLFSPFLDMLNISLPCSDECPIEFMVPKSCQLTYDDQDLILNIQAPQVNKTLSLVEADPFELFYATNNKTCRFFYNGPRFVIVSSTSDCIHTVNIRDARHDLILAPSGPCDPPSEIPENSKHFVLDRCNPQEDQDERKFIQIKPYNTDNHIYCPGNTITIDGKQQRCPKEVFILPSSTSFKINDQEYSSNSVHLITSVNADPTFTMRANWRLHPTADLDQLEDEADRVSADDPTRPLDSGHYSSHPMTWIGLTCLISLSIVIFAFALYYRKTRSIKVSVKTVPEDAPGEDEIEMDNLV